MLKQIKIIIMVLIMAHCVIGSAWASLKRSTMKGDPTLTLQSPLGSKNIEDNAYNRCRIIQMMNPKAGKSTETTTNNYNVLATYVSRVYAQAFKISGYIAAEQESRASLDKSNEVKVLENAVERSMSEIARRLNIINSLEAGVVMIESLHKLTTLPPTTFNTFTALENGSYIVTDDCSKLKK